MTELYFYCDSFKRTNYMIWHILLLIIIKLMASPVKWSFCSWKINNWFSQPTICIWKWQYRKCQSVLIYYLQKIANNYQILDIYCRLKCLCCLWTSILFCTDVYCKKCHTIWQVIGWHTSRILTEKNWNNWHTTFSVAPIFC